MNKINVINCIECEIPLKFVESIRFEPKIDFIGKNVPRGVTFTPKGSTYKNSYGLFYNFFNGKKGFDPCVCSGYEVTYTYCYTKYTYEGSAKELADFMKNNNDHIVLYEFRRFFSDNSAVRIKQIAYNEVLDCLSKLPTLIIRTQSGETLHAVMKSDSDAKTIINAFRSYNGIK